MNSVDLFARQSHQHEVRLHDLLALLGFATDGHAPQVLAVVEHIGIGHVVKTIDGGLYVQQQFRVPHVLAHAQPASLPRRRTNRETGPDRRR